MKKAAAANAKNERILRKYLTFLEDAQGRDVKTVNVVAMAIRSFEASTGRKDFAAFHIDQARRFKRELAEAIEPKKRRPLAKATINARLQAVRRFFQWLSQQTGYRSKLVYADADYFNPSANDTRIANAQRCKPSPTAEQIEHVLSVMPTDTIIQRRDRAVVAFVYLTGARDDAVASASLRHVDLPNKLFDQDARDVRTKNRKSFRTWFFPVGEMVERIVCEWVHELSTVELFCQDDPLFPATRIGKDANRQFAPVGFTRRHWSNADAIRRIFRHAFEAAGLPYYNPHSVRDTLALLGERICPNAEAMKAWSQNLGHERMLTTLTSYGTVPAHRQKEILERFRASSISDDGGDSPPSSETILRVLKHLQGGTPGDL